METRANYVVVGTFVLVVIAAAFASILWLARAQFAQGFVYYDILFAGSVNGLDVGASVRLNGIPIGRVTDIQQDPDNPEQVRVTVEIESKVPIKQDAVARMELQSFLTGVAFIEVSGGSRDIPPIATAAEGSAKPPPKSPNPTITAAPTPGLQQALASAPEVMNKIGLVAEDLHEVLNDQNRAAITAALQNLEKLTATLARDADKFEGLVADSDITVKDADGALNQFRTTMVTADDALHDVKHTLSVADGTVQHLDQMLQENRAGIREFTSGGLGDLHRLISDARVLIQGLNRVSSELERDPSRFIWGERREGYKPK